MTAWKTLQFGELARFRNGKSVKPGGEGPYAVFGSNGLIGRSTDFLYCDAIILGRVGAYCGSVAYCPDRFWASDNTIVVEPNEGIFDTRFAYYALVQANLARWAGGAAQPLITQTVLKGVEIRVPPLDVQRRIAAILSAYDDLIEVNTRRIAILEEMARRLFDEWFVKFRFPGHGGGRLQECGLGAIPEGWTEAAIDEIADVYRGRSYKGTELVEFGGMPFINLKCVDREGGFRLNGIKRYSGPFKDSHVVRTGDLVIAVTDMTQERRIVGQCARVPLLNAEYGVISMDLVKIAPKIERERVWLYAWLRWSHFANAVKEHANGANVLHLSVDRITSYKFVRPPTALTQRFSELTQPNLDLADSLTEQNEQLRTARDLLLPKLISGEIDLERAERVAEAAE